MRRLLLVAALIVCSNIFSQTLQQIESKKVNLPNGWSRTTSSAYFATVAQGFIPPWYIEAIDIRFGWCYTFATLFVGTMTSPAVFYINMAQDNDVL